MKLAYRREIDGLRAIAVVSVVLFHAGVLPWSAGYVGVDVFFVISGYLITALLLREQASSGRIDLAAFYARRVRRLMPAVVVVTLATLGASSMLLSPQAVLRTIDSAAAAAGLVANYYFEAVTGGYFDSKAAEMPLLHLWSLAVEEQFYLIWPALLLLLVRYRPRALVATLALLGLASFALSELLIQYDPQIAFFHTSARFWELCAGGLVAATAARPQSTGWWAGGAVIALLASTIVPIAHFPGAGALPAVAATAAILWLIHGRSELGLAGAGLGSRPLVAVGRISYSFYLWHWPLLALYRATTIGEGSPEIRLALCLVALLLAAASYRYIEQPFRQLQVRKGQALIAGGGVTAVLLVTALSWSAALRHTESLRPVDNPIAARIESDLPEGWRRCHYQGWDSEFPRPHCESLPGQAPQLVMWGDSMAMAWKPLAWELARIKRVSAIDHSRDACPPLPGYLPVAYQPGDLKCRDFNARVLASLSKGQTLIVVMRMGHAIEDARVAELARGLGELSKRVAHVYVMGPSPEMADAVPKCVRENMVVQCAIARADFDAIAVPKLKMLKTAAEGLGNVTIVDVSSYFCTDISCPPLRNGIGMYWDSHHVSATAARRFAIESRSMFSGLDETGLGNAGSCVRSPGGDESSCRGILER